MAWPGSVNGIPSYISVHWRMVDALGDGGRGGGGDDAHFLEMGRG